jgi:hypothetical protein
MGTLTLFLNEILDELLHIVNERQQYSLPSHFTPEILVKFLNEKKEELAEKVNISYNESIPKELSEWFRTVHKKTGMCVKSSRNLISLFMESLEEAGRLEIFDDYIKAAETEKDSLLLTLILQSTIDKKDIEFFTETLKSLTNVGFMRIGVEFSKEKLKIFDKIKKHPEIPLNQLHFSLIYLLNEMGNHDITSNAHLRMLDSLLWQAELDFDFRTFLLDNISSFPLKAQYFILDSHALNHWHDFDLNATDLNKKETKNLRTSLILLNKHPAFNNPYNTAFKEFGSYNSVRNWALIENALSQGMEVITSRELLKKESQKKLSSKLKEYPHNMILQSGRKTFIEIIRARLFLLEENNRLQQLSVILLLDLKEFCLLSGKDFTRVFNNDIHDNFTSEVIRYIEKETNQSFFSNSDSFFYETSNLVKMTLRLPDRPKPPQWVSDFLQQHVLFEEWKDIGNKQAIERNLLWRMEIHEKIIIPLNKLRTEALLAPLLFSNKVFSTPLAKKRNFEPEIMPDIQKFIEGECSRNQKTKITF